MKKTLATLAILVGVLIAPIAPAQAAAAGNEVINCSDHRSSITVLKGNYAPINFDAGYLCLVSPNSVYYAQFQSNGNFVVFRSGAIIFSTGTQGNPYGGGKYFRLQGDGNVVIYNIYGQPMWATNTYQRIQGSSYQLVLQNDGNLAVYDRTFSGDVPRWCSFYGAMN